MCWCVDYFSEETAKVQNHIYPATAGALKRFLPVVEGGHQRSDRERKRGKNRNRKLMLDLLHFREK